MYTTSGVESIIPWSASHRRCLELFPLVIPRLALLRPSSLTNANYSLPPPCLRPSAPPSSSGPVPFPFSLLPAPPLLDMPGAEMDNAQAMNAMEEDFKSKREEMRNVAKDCVLVVDNIPKIGPEKYQKLCAKLLQTFDKFGRMRKDDSEARLNVVQDDNGHTLGFAFAEFISPEEAHKAMISLHNLQFDRSHRFWACTAGDLERLQDIPERFVPPQPPTASIANRPNFKSWLLDQRGRDQFMIRHEDTTSIYWHDHVIKPQLVSFFCVFFFALFFELRRSRFSPEDGDDFIIPC